MTMRLRNIFIIVAVAGALSSSAQDPHFTQFYSAPLTVNPAYTGVFEGQVRVMSNYRQQWGNAIDPFTTAIVSGDIKIGKRESDAQNPFNIGFQLMNDRSMRGAFKSNYATLSASYHVPIDLEGYKSFGAGLTASYADRRIDFLNQSFDAQFTSGGFDLSLPTGESALQNLEPFMTVGAGLLYRHENRETGDFFDIGASAFHLNRPRQSALGDVNQIIPVRFSGQVSYQKYLNETTIINLRGLYQNQASVEYMLAGVSYAKLIGVNKEMVGAGIWYRSADAVSPYLFLEWNKVMVGLSYDVTLSDLTKGPKPARSIEMSLQWRVGR
jgi:type IX secretion system PorP/SprF family membrane protein